MVSPRSREEGKDLGCALTHPRVALESDAGVSEAPGHHLMAWSPVPLAMGCASQIQKKD